MADHCYYCEQAFEAYELRPYGPRGSLVCFPCATATPEREEQAKGRFGALLDANEQVSPSGAVTIDSRTSDGPRPSTPDELSAADQPTDTCPECGCSDPGVCFDACPQSASEQPLGADDE